MNSQIAGSSRWIARQRRVERRGRARSRRQQRRSDARSRERRRDRDARLGVVAGRARRATSRIARSVRQLARSAARAAAATAGVVITTRGARRSRSTYARSSIGAIGLPIVTTPPAASVAEDAPRERRRVGQHDVDALLGREPAVDERSARARASGRRPRRTSTRDRRTAARPCSPLPSRDAIEQEVVGEVEVLGKPDVASSCDAPCASARPMIVRWISLVPS